MGEHPPLTREQFREFCDDLHDEDPDAAMTLFEAFEDHDEIDTQDLADSLDSLPEPAGGLTWERYIEATRDIR